MRILSARIFLSFLAGKLKLIARIRYTKFLQIFILGLEVSHRELNNERKKLTPVQN